MSSSLFNFAIDVNLLYESNLENASEKTTKVFESLLYLLPPTPGKQTRGNLLPEDLSRLFIQHFHVRYMGFKRVIYNISKKISKMKLFAMQEYTNICAASSAAAEKGMVQPGILIINNAKYFLKIQTEVVEVNVSCVAEAVAMLIATYFNFNYKYPNKLNMTFAFLEHLFSIPNAPKPNLTLSKFISKLG